MVIILAAGRGSRMGLPDGISKCSIEINGETPVNRLIRQFREQGEEKFKVVIGYGADSVIQSLKEDCELVYNRFHSILGCAYSLSCVDIEKEGTVYIVEGDSIFSDENIHCICRSMSTSVLARSPEYITERSVSINNHARPDTTFNYDKTHKYAFKCDDYESMQLWKIKGVDVTKLSTVLKIYHNSCSKIGEGYSDASGVFPLNLMCSYFCPVVSPDPEGWINLNTEDDIKKAKEMIKNE